jgi:hypothetical protein
MEYDRDESYGLADIHADMVSAGSRQISVLAYCNILNSINYIIRTDTSRRTVMLINTRGFADAQGIKCDAQISDQLRIG